MKADDPVETAPQPAGGVTSDFEDSLGTLPRHEPLALRIAFGLGGFGLLGATAADAIAVAGRHSGFHLLGSIELVQAMVVLLASAAMLAVTILGGHASVHMITNRLLPPRAALLYRFADLVSGLVFLALAAGSAWVMTELWNGFEQTELLHIPLRWLRLLWVVFALLVALRFLGNAARGRS